MFYNLGVTTHNGANAPTELSSSRTVFVNQSFLLVPLQQFRYFPSTPQCRSYIRSIWTHKKSSVARHPRFDLLEIT